MQRFQSQDDACNANVTFRQVKEVEFVCDRIKLLRKEMAAKFKAGEIGYAYTSQSRLTLNKLGGMLHRLINGIDSFARFDRHAVDHNVLSANYKRHVNRKREVDGDEEDVKAPTDDNDR